MPSAPRPLVAKRVRHTLATLAAASAACVLMWSVRAAIAQNLKFFGFIWNLILAWIPLGLALLLHRRHVEARRGAAFWGLGVAWLLFFPNAFYIVTDLVHFRKFGEGGLPRWYDLLMTVAFACGGMFLGCLSLYLLHLAVRERFGWKAGWAFASATLGLGAIGIYLGRFSRLNSWDVLTRPLKLLQEIAELASPAESRHALGFSSAFFLFSLCVCTFVVSMARLHEEEPSAPMPPSLAP